MITLSLPEARFLMLKAQGLTSMRPFGRRPIAVANAVNHLGYVQIDTISVVERAHHHVLWSRIPDYRPQDLIDSLNRPEGVFEYWSHAAAFLPMADYRYSLFRKQAIRSGANCWFHRDDHVMTHVLDRIRAEGPVSARDFESPGRKATSGWWEWKPAKRALEQLFLDGTLMVKERRGFQKVFDLAERVVPEGVDQTLPDRREFIRWKIMQTVKSLGVAESGDFSYGFPNMKTDLEAELKELVAEGRIVRCRVEGERERAGFVLSGSVERFGPIRYDNRMRILSPFDNLVIRRIRFRRLFGRDYQVECYVPASKRRYGYFALPILWRDQCVGLIDCKAHRASRSLEIRRFSGWDSEPIAVPAKRTQEALEAFAEFNGCTRIDNASDKD